MRTAIRYGEMPLWSGMLYYIPEVGELIEVIASVEDYIVSKRTYELLPYGDGLVCNLEVVPKSEYNQTIKEDD